MGGGGDQCGLLAQPRQSFSFFFFFFFFFFCIFFICTVKVVTNTVHNSTYIHLLTIRHVTEFTFIAYLQYTMLLTCKHASHFLLVLPGYLNTVRI